MTNSSEWHTPAAVTRSRTCPGPGSGVSTSTTSGADPIARYCSAFIVPPHGGRPVPPAHHPGYQGWLSAARESTVPCGCPASQPLNHVSGVCGRGTGEADAALMDVRVYIYMRD